MNVDVLKYYDAFSNHKLHLGRMISSSKSSYWKSFPDHHIVFNGNIITKEDGKIWHGDLDLTVDADTLKKIAKELGKELFVVREMNARFGAEKDPVEKVIGYAIWTSEKGKIGE